MNKVIRNLISFSIRNKFFIFFLLTIFLIIGVYTFVTMPIEAFPDITNTQITIVTQWPGRSAQEVERFVTIPLEIQMNSVQRKTNLRSISMFGVSIVNIIFEDGVDDPFARLQVNNLLPNVTLPAGVQPQLQAPVAPTAEIYRYILVSKYRNSRDLLTFQNFVIDRQLRSVPGIGDISVYGGEQKVYEVDVNPGLLAKYNLTAIDVYNAVSNSNVNVGGDLIQKNDEAYVVRGLGLLTSIDDIKNIIITKLNGTPILVKNVADVIESAAPRVGQTAYNQKDDVVEGDVMMRKGENPSIVLAALKEKVNHLNNIVLPADVKMVPVYDRTTLMHFTTHTVLNNLFHGIILVTIVVFLFMAEWRTTVIVAIIIPLSLLFAFVCLRLMGMTANLLSLGAIDFGIIIDGAVVMVEGIFVVLDHKAREVGMGKFNLLAKGGLIKKTGTEMGKAIFFSKLVIITALIPIFSFEKVEGKLFHPLAYTLGFALIGALIFTLTLVPVLTSLLLNKNVKEKKNPFVAFIHKNVKRAFYFVDRNKRASLAVAVIALAVSLYSFKFLGSEFLPELNEGALWIEADLPMSASLKSSVDMSRKIRAKLLAFPEVESVLSQTGRSNDGLDPSGLYMTQSLVNLYPKEEWKEHISLDELTDKIDSSLREYQGVVYNYSQPIMSNVHQAVSGTNYDQCVKLFGDDLDSMDVKADSVLSVLKTVRGMTDLGVVRNIGQPELSIKLNEQKMAAYGVAIGDANSVIQMAIGGQAATEMYEGEKIFDIRIRYQPGYRSTSEEIANIVVPTVTGNKIPLKEIADISTVTGPEFIYRDNNQRFNAVKFTVRDRDLGSTIAEAQQKIDAKLKLPRGWFLQWTGEFENQQRATKRLEEVVPISLILIFILLFVAFGNPKDAGLILLNVPFALIGGILSLHVTGMEFGISAGVGFIALFGICVQNGVILISVFKKHLQERVPLRVAIRKGVESRIRPVVMTALMAMMGLLPAALSTGIGSETQKPLAIVVIGGLFTSTILTLLIFPIIFEIAYRGKFKEVLDEPPQEGIVG
jgi:heavy metal efflux system protein